MQFIKNFMFGKNVIRTFIRLEAKTKQKVRAGLMHRRIEFDGLFERRQGRFHPALVFIHDAKIGVRRRIARRYGNRPFVIGTRNRNIEVFAMYVAKIK